MNSLNSPDTLTGENKQNQTLKLRIESSENKDSKLNELLNEDMKAITGRTLYNSGEEGNSFFIVRIVTVHQGIH